MSKYGGSHAHAQSPSTFTSTGTPASVTLFRRLTWEGTVPLEVRVDAKELPANSDRGLECYYMQAPRVSYLPLLLPEIKRFLMDVVFDEAAGKVLKEEDWWFEGEDGSLLKWHWPIGLIYDSYTVSQSLRAPAAGSQQTQPLRLVLHLASPPTERLLLPPSAEACKQAFMGQLKEADFVRWGNTKRMTGLRKAEQDGIWEGIREHNFDDYWRVAAKITPTTSPARATSPTPVPPSSASAHTRPPSVDPGSTLPDRDGAYAVRSVPVRFYLPDGPVLQEVIPPVSEDGVPVTLASVLSAHLSLLFPSTPAPVTSSHRRSGAPPTSRQPAYALVQGVVCPGDAEMAWLSACMAGADGWVNVCIGVTRN